MGEWEANGMCRNAARTEWGASRSQEILFTANFSLKVECFSTIISLFHSNSPSDLHYPRCIITQLNLPTISANPIHFLRTHESHDIPKIREEPLTFIITCWTTGVFWSREERQLPPSATWEIAKDIHSRGCPSISSTYLQGVDSALASNLLWFGRIFQ